MMIHSRELRAGNEPVKFSYPPASRQLLPSTYVQVVELPSGSASTAMERMTVEASWSTIWATCVVSPT